MPETNNTSANRRKRTPAPIDPTYGHLQPQAVDVEKVVLGALMIDKDAFSVVSEMLRPETFYEPRHQKIYQAIQTLNMAQNPVDIMTVANELQKEGTLDDVGGPTYVVDLTAHVASSAHIEYHAKILQQKFLARQLISFASVIETKAFDQTVDVDDLMQEAESNLFELSQKNMRTDYTQIDPVLRQAMEMLQTPGFMSLNISGNMAVIKTRPGYASAIAYNIDNANIDSILGTIAGDDTIFMVVKEGVDEEQLFEELNDIIGEG